MKQLRIITSGDVQGVYFRQTARQKALLLGLTGLARNEPDGTVYIEVEGTSEALDTFGAWCHEGPPHATVESVKVSEQPAVGHRGFEIQ